MFALERHRWEQKYPVTSLRSYIRHSAGKELEEITKDTGHAFKHFPEVKEALLEAARTGREVWIVGDYDVDGVTSLRIMISICVALGCKYHLIAPKRFSEGYGFSDKHLARIPDGVVLVTIDNGITCIEPIKKAKERGMYVIVLDHHQAIKDPETGELTLPEADILIDPSAIGEADFTGYCGAGIAYRLATYILGEGHPLLENLSVYAMLGTIADCMELTNDNRLIVKKGLDNLKKGICDPAVLELRDKCKIDQASTATDIAFNVAPVLNAPGRLHDAGAQKVVEALVLGGEKIDSIIADNNTRKDIVATTMSEIDLEAMQESDDNIIIYRNDNVPEGIVGIIAGKISEGTNKPAICLTWDNENGGLKGSARSPRDDFSLVEVISKHKDLLVRVGGHAKAAGLALLPENLEAFKEALNKDVPAGEKKEDVLYWDLQTDDIHFPELAKQVFALEPTGEGLPSPVIRIKTRIKPNGMNLFGGKKEKDPNTGEETVIEPPKHVRFNCNNFSAVAFNDADWVNEQLRRIPKPHYVDMIGKLSKNYYKGNETTQIRIIDFKLS